MESSLKLMALAAISGMASQPCFGAVSQPAQLLPLSSKIATAPPGVQFDFANVEASAMTSASMTIAASEQTASEQKEQPRRKGIPTSTLLLVGGVILAVAVLAAVAGAMPTAGPREGAFD
jgi:hypothetical protein